MPDAVADLILARLLVPSKKPPAPGAVEKAVTPLLRKPPAKGFVAASRPGLQAAGLLTTPGLTLTPAGRTRALAYLGIDALPAKSNWGTVQAKYLLPLALGLTVEEAGRLDKQPKLVGFLLKRKFDLPVGATGAKALEALVCRLLGFPRCAGYDELAAAVVGRHVGSELRPDQLPTQGVRALLGTTGHDLKSLRAASLAGAFGSTEREPEPPAATLDLAAFAARVLAAAKSCPTGRFGRNKVFIAHVWRHLAAGAALSLGDFKARLVEANQRRLLNLGPADLNPVFDAAELRESETLQYPSTFHFVLTGDAP